MAKGNGLGAEEVRRADLISWALLIFALVRCVAWATMILFTLLALAGVTEFHWSVGIAGRLVTIALISYYANAATDLDTVTSAYAAVRAGRAHAQAAANDEKDDARHADALKRIEDLAELIHEYQLRGER